MLHGKGNQDWYTKTYEKKRRKALRWRYDFTGPELTELDILPNQGTGKTKDEFWQRWQSPFPMNQAVRRKKKIDIRKVDPRIGD